MARSVALAIAWLWLMRWTPAQHPEDLRQAVEAYFTEVTEEHAAVRLRELLARADATSAALLDAVMAAPEGAPKGERVHVPHHGLDLVVDISVPPELDRDGPRAPVVIDLSHNNLDILRLDRAITVSIPGYTPPEFTDEGRDGFLKVLRTAAHHAHGDPDRLWAVGYSWAAHACWDTAMHRPLVLRGIVPMAGGPRRNHFRLLRNLADVTILEFCGGKDDPELLWNLHEVARRQSALKLDYDLTITAESGHTGPHRGLDAVAARIAASPPALRPDQGRLLADAVNVEIPLLRIDEVDDKRVDVPTRIPVSSTLSADGKRRATLAAMEKQVASIDWSITRTPAAATIELKATGVKRCTVLLRVPEFAPGQLVTLRAGRKLVQQGEIEVDRTTLLEEARRSGERLRPAITRIPVRFP